jgi:enamine deaminase RidA (YjgF/YER057c/UK114 family)
MKNIKILFTAYLFCFTSFLAVQATAPIDSSENLIPLTVEQKIIALGLTLPTVTPPIASYVPSVSSGNLVFMAGTLPMEQGKIKYTGHLGKNVTLEDGQAAAELCMLNMLAQLKAATGNLDAITRCVKITVLVNSTSDFAQHPEVANGASNLLVKILGEKGSHARAAFGTASLPRNAAVEIEGIFEVEN